MVERPGDDCGMLFHRVFPPVMFAMNARASVCFAAHPTHIGGFNRNGIFGIKLVEIFAHFRVPCTATCD